MLDLFKKLFTKIPVKLRWVTYVVLAFTSVVSFFNINSAWADAHKANGILTVIGIVTGLIVVLATIVAVKENEE